MVAVDHRAEYHHVAPAVEAESGRGVDSPAVAHFAKEGYWMFRLLLAHPLMAELGLANYQEAHTVQTLEDESSQLVGMVHHQAQVLVAQEVCSYWAVPVMGILVMLEA